MLSKLKSIFEIIMISKNKISFSVTFQIKYSKFVFSRSNFVLLALKLKQINLILNLNERLS